MLVYGNTCTLLVLHIIICSKQVFDKTPDFVHLNLSIALLVGLLIFVCGIETATKYRVSHNNLIQLTIIYLSALQNSCLIVSILLHYFFMATFSWMLCEGIILFVWLNFLLYDGLFKTRKFFMILGWG